MSRCEYCRCQLPGLETICQKCFEGRSDQLDHPVPWWHFRWFLAPRWSWCRPRLTRISLYAFLFMFALAFLPFRLYFHPLTMKASVLIALAFALVSAFLESAMKDRPSNSKQKKAPEG
jgi:hypothetical protein